MAALDTTRAALRNAMRACIVTSANQAALLNDFPHGGTELGKVSAVSVGIQDQVYVPQAWEFGGPSDHGFRASQTWVLALRLEALEDADWRAIAFRTTTPTDGYAPSEGTIKQDQPGYVAAGGILLLSPIDVSHLAVVCYAPVRGIGPAPVDWGSSKPAAASLLFTLGRHFTIGEPVAVDRLEHLRLS